MKQGFKFGIMILQFVSVMILTSNVLFAEVLTVRASKDNFPATYLTESGWQGMDIEIVQELFSRVKATYRIVAMPFKRSLVEMQNGKIDVIPNLTKNRERSVYMNWLGPVRITRIGLVVQEKDLQLPIRSCDDLIAVSRQKKKQFGYVRGASYSKDFDSRLKTDAMLRKALYFTTGTDQNLKMLHGNRILGFFHDDFETRQRLLSQNRGHDKWYEGLVLHSYIIEGSSDGAYIGVSKKMQSALYQNLEAAFQSMKEDGSFAAIHLKWVGKYPGK